MRLLFLALPAASAFASDVTGTWNFAVDLASGGHGDPVFVLQQSGSRISGRYNGPLGEQDVTGTIEGNKVTIELKVEGGSEGFTMIYSGNLETAGKMAGEVRRGDRVTGKWLAVKSVAAAAAPARTGDPIDDYIGEQMAARRIPGLALAIVKNGHVFRSRAYGMANLETDTRVTPHSVFDLASVTKPFTAMAVMMLAEDGKLSLNDSVRKYVSGLPQAWDQMTVAHLLSHTSGLPELFPSEISGPGLLNVATADLFSSLVQLPLSFAPGRGGQYSDSRIFSAWHGDREGQRQTMGRVPDRSHLRPASDERDLDAGSVEDSEEPGLAVPAAVRAAFECAPRLAGGAAFAVRRVVDGRGPREMGPGASPGEASEAGEHGEHVDGGAPGQWRSEFHWRPSLWIRLDVGSGRRSPNRGAQWIHRHGCAAATG
jgi:hypothetical protein